MNAIYETVTNQIIAELEAGAIPWTQPWKNQRRGGVMPQNASTGTS
jgi:antirestriction protein ArdC